MIKTLGLKGLKDRAAYCLNMTDYTLKALRKIHWPSWCNPGSNIVVIKKPEDAIIKKWHLASESNIAHVILMPGIRSNQIELFIHDLVDSQTSKPEEVFFLKEETHGNSITHYL